MAFRPFTMTNCISTTLFALFWLYTLSSIPVVSAATSARPFVAEVLVFLLFKGKLIKHANHRTRLGAVC